MVQVKKSCVNWNVQWCMLVLPILVACRCVCM
jgi:hypothetical protein